MSLTLESFPPLLAGKNRKKKFFSLVWTERLTNTNTRRHKTEARSLFHTRRRRSNDGKRLFNEIQNDDRRLVFSLNEK